MKKIAVIHQPNFMPWLGLFDKISKGDIFIILDNVTFGYRSKTIINRNHIKTPSGAAWLTVPVHASFDDLIRDVIIDNTQDWRETHLKTICCNYKKAPNFETIYPLLEKLYTQKYEKLIDLNLATIDLFLDLFGIKREQIMSSSLKPQGQKNDLLIDLCRKVSADIYLSGRGAKDYLDQKLFNTAGVEVIIQEFQPPSYKQLWGEFIPNLSALDFVFNEDYKNLFIKR